MSTGTYSTNRIVIILLRCSQSTHRLLFSLPRDPCDFFKLLHREPTRREHALGIALSITVAFIWVGSSETISYVFGETNFQKPFLFTYISTAVFSVLLLGFLRPSWRALFDIPSIRAQNYVSVDGNTTNSDTVPEPGDASRTQHVNTGDDAKFNVRDVARVSALIAPLYFIANWAFNAGLGMTSVSSSSTFSNLSPLFTLLVSRVLAVEEFSWVKLFASLITLSGAVIILGVDRKSATEHLRGDLLSIFAAFLFGVYTTTLKMNVPNSRAMDLGMMLSFVGLFSTVIAWPIIPLLHVWGWETFELPSKHVAGIMILNALIGSVLSDFLWAKSVVLTSALVGTIALSLTVPLSLIFDVVLQKIKITPMYVLGVVCVLAGFIMVNVELASKRSEETEEEDETVLSINGLQKNASIGGSTDKEEEELMF